MKTIKYDDKQIVATQGFEDAIKVFMKETILMMREVEPDYKECWVVGTCQVEDLANARGLTFKYGELEESASLKEKANFFMEVPL